MFDSIACSSRSNVRSLTGWVGPLFTELQKFLSCLGAILIHKPWNSYPVPLSLDPFPTTILASCFVATYITPLLIDTLNSPFRNTNKRATSLTVWPNTVSFLSHSDTSLCLTTFMTYYPLKPTVKLIATAPRSQRGSARAVDHVTQPLSHLYSINLCLPLRWRNFFCPVN